MDWFDWIINQLRMIMNWYTVSICYLGMMSGSVVDENVWIVRIAGSSYEECRAECAGLHLCLVPGVPEIFGFAGEEAEQIKYANWLTMVHAGVKGLEMFSPASMEWKQAHSQARWELTWLKGRLGE